MALTVVGVAATISLVLSGRLSLYIHPRYTVFTTVMAVLAGLACLAALAVLPGSGEHDHGQHSEEPTGTAPRRRHLSTGLRVIIIGLATVSLLILPPATLTATTLQNRDVASSSRVRAGTDVRTLVGSDPSTLTVKDWAGLLDQGGPEAVADKPVRVSGFVLDRGDDTVFYAARMLVTCCAVDGQPVGIPVRRAGWRDEFRTGDWIQLDGSFVENADRTSRFRLVVDPATIQKIDEPEQPYVF